MRIEVNQDICIGDGSCVMLAGKTFKLNEKWKCYILSKPPVGENSSNGTVKAEVTAEMDERDALIEAARACPVQAIRLFEDDGTEIKI
jgi:ferredoxin